MPDEIHEIRETRTREPGHVHENAPVVTSETAGSRIAQVIYVITGILLSLLAFRVILSLLGANPGNPFADFIYSVTHPLVAPFFGLFNYQFERGINRFEIETVIAMLVYALIGWALVSLATMGDRRSHHYHYR